MGPDLVAEGVEGPAQAAYLEAMAWTHLQGYLLGAVMPAEEIERRLTQDRPATA